MLRGVIAKEVMSTEIRIRQATQADLSLILEFVQSKAEFDQAMGAFTGTLQTTEEKLRNSLFAELPFARVLIAELLERSVGFALYYFRYSSFMAQPSLWLDDLYVNSEVRSQGVGSVLMRQLVGIAKDNNCTHLGWTASFNNVRGVKFYEGVGAQIVDRKGDTLFFRINPDKFLRGRH